MSPFITKKMNVLTYGGDISYGNSFLFLWHKFVTLYANLLLLLSILPTML